MLRPGRIVAVTFVALVLAVVAIAVTVGLGGSTTEHGVPNYQPSSVVSQAPGSTTLSSSDSVEKVTAFYLNVIHAGRWHTVSQSVTGHNASLTIKKSHQGASILISPTGSHTVISISTNPTL
jgi:hypothetical protein